MSRRLLGILVCCCIALVTAAPASARGHLDRSFGENGVVDLTRGLTAGSNVGQFVTGPDDSVLITAERWVCSRGGCPVEIRLVRYRPNGSLDRRFGERAAVVAQHPSGFGYLTVDAAGRVLYGWKSENRIEIRRLRRDGAADRSFGQSGRVVLVGGGLFVAASATLGEVTEPTGSRWFFARLRSDGGLYRRFGGDGIVDRAMPGYRSAYNAPTPAGGLLLGGDRWTESELFTPPFVSRLSPQGRLDFAYTRRATRSLRGIHETGRQGIGWRWMNLFPRPRGKALIYASTYDKGVAVRILRDGGRDRSYGSGGARVVPLTEADAAADSVGGLYVASYLRRLHDRVVMRLRPDGSTDRRFGFVSLGGFGEDGPGVSALSGGGAIVFDSGVSFCRSECPPPSPTMTKVLP